MRHAWRSRLAQRVRLTIVQLLASFLPDLRLPSLCQQVFAHSVFDYVDLKIMLSHWTGCAGGREGSIAGMCTPIDCLLTHTCLPPRCPGPCRLEFEGGPLLLLKRFGFRWLFVLATAGIAVCLPFMGELMGLVGEPW